MTMNKVHNWRTAVFSDLGILILLALVKILLHTLTNNQYGFHRDELDMIDSARHLDWSYVAYPPVTPFIAWLELKLFGPSLVGLRFFASVAMGAVMVLAGLMAGELGGTRPAKIVAALAAGIVPMALVEGSLFHYSSFDYLWWVLIAYLTIRLLKTENPRWWLITGVVIGLGMMTKYTFLFIIAGLASGILITQNRRYLASPWLWAGVGLSLLIFLPNIIWQAQHGFISLEFSGSIHARDVQIGRANDFLIFQLLNCANPFTIPLWVAGLYYFLAAADGKPYRLLGWMYVVPLLLFILTRGRGYYLAPAYPMLFASGAVFGEKWLASLANGNACLVKWIIYTSLAAGAIFGIVLCLPIAPVNSSLWEVSSRINGEIKEEIGWPELVVTVAHIYATLPAEEKSQTGIYVNNYGEAGAINLYGPAYGLPEAISGINSYWLRGYGNPPPQTLIILGTTYQDVYPYFETCKVAGHVTNRYGVSNEETTKHPAIFVCRGPLQPWPELWPKIRQFG